MQLNSGYYWFPWYPELYRLDTQHLTAEQDGIYRRLIDCYMESRQPLPDNDVALARIAGVSVDAWAMAAAMLRPFFRPSKDGKLHHKKCDAELDRQDKLTRFQSEKGKRGANARWNKKKKKQDDNSSGHSTAIGTGNAPAMPELMPGDATETETIKKKDKKKENLVLPEWIPEPEWNAYLEFRKQKKATNTLHALKLAVGELEKLRGAGHDPAAVLNQSIMRGWTGLFAVKAAEHINGTPPVIAAPHGYRREVA